MIRVSVMYPNEDDGRFDHDYYETEHRDLVRDRLGPHGLLRIEADRGLAGMEDAAAPFVAAGHLYFETVEEFEAGLEAHGEEILGDIPNFTNLEPVLQVSRISLG
jgi:uncharacterized protein (TIGR02118 family)